jgi:hypothetical protein
MNQRELERLEKESLYTIRMNPDIKDQVVSVYLNELSRVVKKEVRKKDLVVIVIEKKL